MDYVLAAADAHVLTPYVYPAWVAPEQPLRQFASLFAIISASAALLYLAIAGASWLLLFDKRLRSHKLFLKDQEWLEIRLTLSAVPGMALLTTVLFLAEVRGYSRLYDEAAGHGGWPFLALSFVTFLLFTDMCIYWIHRWLHTPLLYPLHKLHHKWKIPTPFASHAFHPLDGFAQSVPYHLYIFLFPLHKGLYLGLFFFVNVWSVMIHDGNYALPKLLQPIINGCAHHSDHHAAFTVNYGQYFTLWDRIGGSYQHPSAYEGKDVHDEMQGAATKAEFNASATIVTGAVKRTPASH